MTSTPAGSSKGKGCAPTNWHLCTLLTVPTVEQISTLELPIEIIPEQRDTVPTEYTVNTQFLVSGTSDGPPWTGYFVNLPGARLAVTNVYGVWYKIH